MLIKSIINRLIDLLVMTKNPDLAIYVKIKNEDNSISIYPITFIGRDGWKPFGRENGLMLYTGKEIGRI